jgi:hypothetical protein
VPVRVNKRVNVNDALVFDHNYVGVQIEGLEFFKNDIHALIQLQFKESDIGSRKGLLTHVQQGAVLLLRVDLEIECVICPHKHFFLERISILILENFVIFGYDKILRKKDVVMLLKE